MRLNMVAKDGFLEMSPRQKGFAVAISRHHDGDKFPNIPKKHIPSLEDEESYNEGYIEGVREWLEVYNN